MQHPKYPNLFSKGKVGKLTVKNRVIRNSMGTYLNIGKTCDLSDRNLKHAAEAAEGGPGIVFLDNCLIMEGYHMGLAAYDDTYIPGLSMLAQAMHDHGAVAGMQLAHPGRDMGFTGGDDAVAPSAVLPEIMINAGAAIPRPLAIDEIHEIEEQYGQAAARVKQAGFDIVEVHGACGCLPTNFLSPHDNQRNDIYGGSLFNRQRFLVEVIRVIKRYVGPDFPVSVKLDMDDCEPDGIRLEECIDTCKVLEREGVALLNLVTATHVTANFSTSFYPWSYCADMAAKVKEQVHIPVMVTGAIQSPKPPRRFSPMARSTSWAPRASVWPTRHGSRRLAPATRKIFAPASVAKSAAPTVAFWDIIPFRARPIPRCSIITRSSIPRLKRRKTLPSWARALRVAKLRSR